VEAGIRPRPRGHPEAKRLQGRMDLSQRRDPNELVILLEWDSSENARRFADAEDLREAMQRAGVADRPDVYVLEEVERVRA
jgi:heme-degrading monooxygenase HmoA